MLHSLFTNIYYYCVVILLLSLNILIMALNFRQVLNSLKYAIRYHYSYYNANMNMNKRKDLRFRLQVIFTLLLSLMLLAGMYYLISINAMIAY